ncbi:MAG: hypothetical protein WB005_05565, partial [Pseudolabrys sp.]
MTQRVVGVLCGTQVARLQRVGELAESLSKVWDALNDEIAEIVMTLAPEREVHPAIESRPVTC